MARPASTAVGGFYESPPLVISLLRTWLESETHFVACDPCSGKGEALFQLGEEEVDGVSLKMDRMAFCEMEATRYKALHKKASRSYQHQTAHGDFFHLKWVGDCDFLYLNPPYDQDPDFKRLEEKFLRRAVDGGLLRVGGWMAFVVPFYALSASAKTLADNFEDLTCLRFPDEHWGDFRQVVLLARRKTKAKFEASFPEIEAQVNGWAADANTIPVLAKTDKPIANLHVGTGRGFSNWEMGSVDLEEVKANYVPWEGVASISPPDDIQKHFRRTFPVASRPRASHLAGAIAAGIFNGMKIVPSDPSSNLPPVLIKGVFDKDYRRVEDKINKDGEKVAEVQVQQPKLSVCLLDLSTGIYHTVSPVDGTASPPTIETLSMRDVLAHYGQSLMAGMMKACPVLQDDPNYPDVSIPGLVRQPFPAQMDAIQTLVKLRKQKPRHGGVVLGEIGSGKTTVALTTGIAMGVKRPLVVCPPHLLDGWKGEIKACMPEAETILINSVTDAQRFASSTSEGTVIGVLSREKAKLGHKWVTVKGSCPDCGGALAKKDYAKKRETCTNKHQTPDNEISQWVLENLPLIMRYVPGHALCKLNKSRFLGRTPRVDWALTPEVKAALLSLSKLDLSRRDLNVMLAWVDPDLALPLALKDKAEGRAGYQHILMAAEDHSGFPQEGTWYRWDQFNSFHDHLRGKGPVPVGSWDFREFTRSEEGSIDLNGHALGSLSAFSRLLALLMAEVSFSATECGGILYQAVPSPRRVALATWIRRYAPESYDMLVVDESHEYGSPDSAQTMAVQRLMQTKAYILHLTGSFMNGYASSVFMNLRALSPDFRAEFGRDDLTRFIDRYGYWKRIVQEKDLDGEILEYGAVTDRRRVVSSVRKAGVAPGILPLFNLEHLLPIAVTLQKEDLELNIPPRSDEVVHVGPCSEQATNYNHLKTMLTAEIKKHRFTPGLAGKLWGAMARLPFYFDLASVGNTEGGTYDICWPANVPDLGGKVIASVPLVNPSATLPKEELMLERVAEEIAEGRNCIVFTYHTKLMPRIAALIAAAGHKVEVLEASKVPTAKRLKWITTKVVKKKVQVLVVNPVSIQTGLNNLVHFATEIWMENPMCNPTVFRQACGRIDRIGQTKPSRVVFPLYEGPQESAHSLLMHKVGVSAAVDGLDPEEALRSAGLIEADYMAFSVGTQLYNMIMEEAA